MSPESFMRILENGKKTELIREWKERCDIERATQRNGSALDIDSDLTWTLKLLYYTPDNVQDYVWDQIGQTGFEDPEIQKEEVIKLSQELLVSGDSVDWE